MKIPAENESGVAAVPTDVYCGEPPNASSTSSNNNNNSSNSNGVSQASPQQPADLDSPTLDGDFSEYMWMENEEEFDKQVMQQLEEEALMEQCIEAMLEDERIHAGGGGALPPPPITLHPDAATRGTATPPTAASSGATATSTSPNNNAHYRATHQPWSDGGPIRSSSSPHPLGLDICSGLQSLRVIDQDEIAKQSTLNPDAEEFVPQRALTVEKAA